MITPGAKRRFTRTFPCPICGGSDDDERGQSRRCFGFVSSDGQYAHCTREDHANGELPYHASSRTWAHKLGGRCLCGTEHGPAPPGSEKPAAKTIDATYDYRDADGKRLFQVVRLRPKGFRQRRPDPEKPGGWIWNLRGVEPVLYRLPELLAADPAETVFLVEGEKDADRLGRFGLIATCNPMGAGKWRDRYSESLRGRHVAIVPDNDRVGRDHAEAAAKSLAGIAAQVKLIDLAGDLPDLPEHGDVSDYLDRGRSIEDLRRLVSESPTWQPAEPGLSDNGKPERDNGKAEGNGKPDGGKPQLIRCKGRPLQHVTADALAALGRAYRDALSHEDHLVPPVFQCGAELVRLRFHDDRKPAREILSHDAIRGVLARSALWVVFNAAGDRETYVVPPMETVKDVASLPHWDEAQIPRLESVIESPRFDRGGKLIVEPGYHPESRTWYRPDPTLCVPDIPTHPTAEDVCRAKDLLMVELVGDFPFKDNASRAHAVAIVIAPFVRAMIDGPTPIHIIEAPKAGTGKGLLATVVAIPACGRGPVPVTESDHEEEWRKRITSILIDDPTYVLFDNVNRHLDSSALASVTTAWPTFSDRILGQSKIVSMPVRCIWVVTANNISMSVEMSRRPVLCRLIPDSERPWDKPASEFRHPHLARWAIDNRSSLVWAALVLIRNWIAKGKPRGAKTLGSFEAWAEIIGGILGAANIEGFLGNKAEPYENATEDVHLWRAFIDQWRAVHGEEKVGTAELFDMAKTHTLLSPLLDAAKTEAGAKVRLGRELSKRIDCYFGDHRLARVGYDRGGVAQYRLVPKCGPKGAEPVVEAEV